MQDYIAFEGKHAAFISAKKLSPDDIKHCMHLLSICELGARQASLSFADIAKALSVAVDQVEGWVIDAISQGLIEAFIDQPNELVLIT